MRIAREVTAASRSQATSENPGGPGMVAGVQQWGWTFIVLLFLISLPKAKQLSKQRN